MGKKEMQKNICGRNYPKFQGKDQKNEAQKKKVNKTCIIQKGPGIDRQGNFFQKLEKAQKMQLRITN